MPLYYFNLRYGPDAEQLAIDPEGDDLPDLDAARAHALLVARDLIARTQLGIVRDWFACSFEIEDTEARALLTVPFSDTVSDRDASTVARPDAWNRDAPEPESRERPARI